jgi:ribosome-associated translation inhibitor RaiA
MRITFSGINTPVTGNQRAYAEYRFFTVVARHDAVVETVTVAIRRGAAADRRFLCTVAVVLRSSATVKALVRAVHPSAAIDRAADRIAWLLDRRTSTDCAGAPYRRAV